jgi:L-fuconate dehydratase
MTDRKERECLDFQVPMNPEEGYSMAMYQESKDKYRFPEGSYWSSPEAKKAHGLE